MKVIPIISIEDKILGIPKPDFIILLVVEVFTGIIKEGFDTSSLFPEFVVLIVFLVYLNFKKSLEKKEQALFSVLWVNSRISNMLIGRFKQQRLMGISKDNVFDNK
jgi:hypothetical protein